MHTHTWYVNQNERIFGNWNNLSCSCSRRVCAYACGSFFSDDSICCMGSQLFGPEGIKGAEALSFVLFRRYTLCIYRLLLFVHRNVTLQPVSRAVYARANEQEKSIGWEYHKQSCNWYCCVRLLILHKYVLNVFPITIRLIYARTHTRAQHTPVM